MDSTRECDELPAQQVHPEVEERRDTMPFPPPVQSSTGEVTFGHSPPPPDVGDTNEPDESSTIADAFGAPESLEIPESLGAYEVREARDETAPEPQAGSAETPPIPATAAETSSDVVDFAELLAELDAAHDASEPNEAPALPNPAAALRGQRWIEPKRVSLRPSKPDSFRPTTRRVKSRRRAQSAVAIVLACGAVIGGALIGVRVAMSRSDGASAGMLAVPRVTSSPSIAITSAQSAPTPSAVPQVPAPVSSDDAIVEPPSSATAVLPAPKAAPPAPKRTVRANIRRNSPATAKSSRALGEPAAVPVDEVYVNKSGELVDAHGQPLRNNAAQSERHDSEPVAPAAHDASSEPTSAPLDETNSPREEPTQPKTDEPAKSVDEAQPWH